MNLLSPFKLQDLCQLEVHFQQVYTIWECHARAGLKNESKSGIEMHFTHIFSRKKIMMLVMLASKTKLELQELDSQKKCGHLLEGIKIEMKVTMPGFMPFKS